MHGRANNCVVCGGLDVDLGDAKLSFCPLLGPVHGLVEVLLDECLRDHHKVRVADPRDGDPAKDVCKFLFDGGGQKLIKHKGELGYHESSDRVPAISPNARHRKVFAEQAPKTRHCG